MDYFLKEICTFTSAPDGERLSEEHYGKSVWAKDDVQNFLENNLGLSKKKRIRGRIVSGHNEALFFWKELIEKGDLQPPFEVVHIDSHADLGLGYSSWTYILKSLIQYPISERVQHNKYESYNGKEEREDIGDYLLFAIAYRWISKLTYCANPVGTKNDYLWNTLKDFHENMVWNRPVENIIQLVYNPQMGYPDIHATEKERRRYLDTAQKEPEVPMLIIPSIEDVKYNGDFDFAVMAQSPNYTPASADFILGIFREYIEEC